MRYRCQRRGNMYRKYNIECGQRVKLRKAIDTYKKRPLCPACGHDSLRLDLAHHIRKRKLKCVCAGVPYPHERGTVLGCVSYTKVVTEEKYKEYLDQLKRASIAGNSYA